ncbi:MAG: mandelate racemase/muconate lactonizing enzyme family protein [Alphaproteobacteria bacterium]|nr:MAG: mandelate racemase/muconate lactonizing enzyme family protein [Alphaproteobacteria bacterium]
MKIASVKAIPITYIDHQQVPLNYLFVRIETDNGLIGYGEVCDSYACTNPLSVAAIIHEALAPLLVDEDPVGVDRLAFKMRGWTRRRLGDQGVVIQAISGVEIALWDLAGKAQNKSVSRMLGRHRDHVPIYASGTFLQEGSADWHMSLFEPCLARGATAIKVRTALNYNDDLHTLRQLRSLLGDDIQIMVDGSEHYTMTTALEIAKALADLGVVFFEEPIPQHNRAGIARLVEKSPLPIAYGEHLFTIHDFQDCLSQKRADVIQPDAAICGGLAEAMKIVTLAETFGARVAPHSAAGPIALAANLHLCAAASNIWKLEYAFTLGGLWQEMLREPILLPDTLQDGCLAVPDGPGLGLSIDEDVWNRYPYQAKSPVKSMPTWSLGNI